MADLQSDIQRLVDSFVAQITQLANQAAIVGLQNALGRTGSRRSAGRVGGGRGQKRAAEELAQVQGQLLSFVSKNPGLRIEQINKQLGTRTKDLALPIRKLIADGALKTKGKKRSTAYFATGRN